MLLYIALKLHAEAFIPRHNYEESVKSVEIFPFNAARLIEMSKAGVWGGGSFGEGDSRSDRKKLFDMDEKDKGWGDK